MSEADVLAGIDRCEVHSPRVLRVDESRAMAVANTNSLAEGAEMIRAAANFYRAHGIDPTAEIDWLEHYEAGEVAAAVSAAKVEALVEAAREALSELETIDGNLLDGRDTYVSDTRVEALRAALAEWGRSA